MLYINGNNDQVCTGIKPTILFSAEGPKLSAVTTQPWRHISNRNSGKYTDRLSRFYHWRENHEWVVKIRVSIAYIQLKFDEIQNDYLTQTLVFLAGVELKKINSCLRRLNLLIYFKRVRELLVLCTIFWLQNILL